MKLRRLAEDFVVDEQSSLKIGESGRFAVYRLSKTHQTTLDAVSQISREWGLSRKRIQHAGLKDRHAVTTQWITIENGPAENLDLDKISLEFLGRSQQAIAAKHIESNRFKIVLRSMSQDENQIAAANLPRVASWGFLNYFDDQRFGSLPQNGEFIAAAWIREDYERALWLALAEHLAEDSFAEREQKALLREHWGNWSEAKRVLSKSHRRSIITFLDDRPGDFAGAFARVNADLRGLWLSAFQSWLWNESVSNLVTQLHSNETLPQLTLKHGSIAFPRDLSRHWHVLSQTVLPLPSARLNLTPGFQEDVISQSLENLGWELDEIKVRKPRDRFFSKAQRSVIAIPENLNWEWEDDELASPLKKLTLRFALRSGRYATMLIKACLNGVASVEDSEFISDDAD